MRILLALAGFLFCSDLSDWLSCGKCSNPDEYYEAVGHEGGLGWGQCHPTDSWSVAVQNSAVITCRFSEVRMGPSRHVGS